MSFGKLVISLACEFFQPGQHPAAPLDHIARNYSPDVKNLVLFLINKPQPGKTVDEVIRMIGSRMLNEFDAMQKWVSRNRALTLSISISDRADDSYVDSLESELGAELENGRIARLLIKLGFINERTQYVGRAPWADMCRTSR